MTTLTVDDGTVVELGAVLAKAGEGSIREVLGRADLVAKVFHDDLSDRPEKLAKVAAMLKTPPPGATQSDGFVVLAWPQHRVMLMGRPTGYLMPRIDTGSAVEIHTLSNPFNRAHPLKGAPQWTVNATWAHLVSVAANLCLAVDVVHRVDAVIGDFQERNVLVSNTARVTLVDCDSMQFTDGDGRQFLCGVARPEFAAPELADVNLRSQPREASSDLFALAVHIYQLLLGGNHPFMRGVWTGAGEQPHALELAKTGCWAGGPGSPLATHPLAPTASFLPTDLVTLFEHAFTEGARDPARRPGAADWRRALLNVRTTSCRRGAHQIPVDAAACPWCAIDEVRARRKQRAAPGSGEKIDPQVISDIPDPTRRTTTAAPKSPRPPGMAPGAGKPSSARRAPGAPKRSKRLGVPHTANAIFTMLLIAYLSTSIVNHYVHAHRSSAHGAQPATSASHDATENSPPTALPSPAPSPTEPPGDARKASAKVIRGAEVGDCIHREVGGRRDDGHFDATVHLSTCWSSDATDEVVMRTDDPGKCTVHGYGWLSDMKAVPPVVLCLDKP